MTMPVDAANDTPGRVCMSAGHWDLDMRDIRLFDHTEDMLCLYASMTGNDPVGLVQSGQRCELPLPLFFENSRDALSFANQIIRRCPESYSPRLAQDGIIVVRSPTRRELRNRRFAVLIKSRNALRGAHGA